MSLVVDLEAAEAFDTAADATKAFYTRHIPCRAERVYWRYRRGLAPGGLLAS